MSLINQMLQDLEKRNPESESNQLPVGVISSAPEKNSKTLRILAGGVLVVLSAAAYYAFNGKATPIPVVAPPAPPAPVVSAPAMPTIVAENQAPTVPVAVAPTETASDASSLPRARVVEQKSKREAKKEKAQKQAGKARENAQPKDKLAGKAKGGIGKIDKSPVQSEAQEMAEALYRQAANSFAQGRSNESLEKLRQSVALDPAHASARQLLAKLLVEQRSYDEARQVLRDGVKHQPAQLQWASILARLELERGDAGAARQALEASMSHAGNSPDYQSLAGAVAQRQGKPDDAAEFYRAALKSRPNDGRSWVGLGLALEAEGSRAEAKEAFRRALATESLSSELEALALRKSR